MLTAREPLAMGSSSVAVTVDEAQKRVLAMLRPPAVETIPLAECLGRVLAEPNRAAIEQPRFDAAAMDGWAVNGITAGLYRIVGESSAGRRADRALAVGEAVRISTGAPMPVGGSRVVRQEHAIHRGALVEVPKLDGDRRDVRQRGCDFRIGDELAGAGRRLDHLDLARLSAAGLESAAVAIRPRISIVATGNEIVPGGKSASADQIYDSLSLPIAARCRGAAAVVGAPSSARDRKEDILSRLTLCPDADVIVFIGGASKGRHDIVRPALGPLGLDVVVASVLMRPGKPFWSGRLRDGRLVVGLPGNPVAALVCVELFLLPLIRAWQGGSPHPATISLRCPTVIAPAGGLESFQFGRLVIDGDGGMAAELMGGQDSAALVPIAGADLLLRHPSIAHGGRQGRAEATRLTY